MSYVTGQDQYTFFNNSKIRYRCAGEGNNIVLLVHGIGGYIEEWGKCFELISKKNRVAALDLIGHGLSDKPDIRYSIDLLTDNLKSFIHFLNTGKVHLVGFSLGGAVCLNLAVKYPELIKSITLINSAGKQVPIHVRLAVALKFIKQINIKISKRLLKITSRKSFYKKGLISDEWIDTAHKFINMDGSIRTIFSIIHESLDVFGLKNEIRNNTIDKLKEIKIPAFIICGNNDKVVPNINSRMLHEGIPGSRISVFNNCGHALHYEYPEEFTEELLDFIEKIEFLNVHELQ